MMAPVVTMVSDPVPWSKGAWVKRGGQMDVELLEQAQDITRPSGRDRRNREQILEDQVPADEPRDAFAQGRVE